MNQKTYLTVVGVIFALIAILHGLRLLSGWVVVLGQWSVPVWASSIGLILAGYLAYTAFKLTK